MNQRQLATIASIGLLSLILDVGDVTVFDRTRQMPPQIEREVSRWVGTTTVSAEQRAPAAEGPFRLRAAQLALSLLGLVAFRKGRRHVDR